MTWASRRQAFILGTLAVVLLTVVGVVTFLIIRAEPEPTCADGIQNQTEDGVDCGGTCAYLCVADLAPPSVAFVRTVPSGTRTDVIAHVVNRNTSAAVKGARYTIELFGADRTLVAARDGVVDLVPGAVTPIFIPGILNGSRFEGQAFLTFNDTSIRWYRESRVVPSPVIEEARVTDAVPPRVTALVRNAGAFPMEDLTLIATVFDAAGTPIAASQTLVQDITARGTASATFFWNESFTASPGRVEVRSVPLLP